MNNFKFIRFLLISTLAHLLIGTLVFSQAPEKMSYQAVIRNSSNALVTNTQIGMEINIRQGSPTGTVVYTETQTPTTNANGLVSIEIGGGTGFNTINWANNTYYIETKTAVVPPLTTYTITGVSQLLSVPYTLHAKTAETITGPISETDPIYGISVAAGITTTDITNWNNKLDATSIPSGIIVMWSGTIAGIPGGWALCDGTNGTPDLSGRFIVSYDAENPDYDSIGNASGSDTYTLTQEQLPSHNHGGTIITTSNGNHNHTGNTGYEGSHTHNSGTLTGRMRGRDNDNLGNDLRGPIFYNYSEYDQTSSSSSLVINGTTGSGSNHLHTISYSGNHNHSVTIGNTGSNVPIDNRPLYYTLAFIMKQ